MSISLFLLHKMPICTIQTSNTLEKNPENFQSFLTKNMAKKNFFFLVRLRSGPTPVRSDTGPMIQKSDSGPTFFFLTFSPNHTISRLIAKKNFFFFFWFRISDFGFRIWITSDRYHTASAENRPHVFGYLGYRHLCGPCEGQLPLAMWGATRPIRLIRATRPTRPTRP